MQKTVKFTSTGTRWSSLKLQAEYKVYGDIYITTSLNWGLHIEHLITKVRKRLHFPKQTISTQPSCQDTKTLLHLFISFVRSKLIYGQEVYFSAPITPLKKLQSIDSKAIKVAIGVPVHTNTIKAYTEAGMIYIYICQNNVNQRSQSK